MKTQLVSPNFFEFWFDLVISMFKFVEMFWFFIYLHVCCRQFLKKKPEFFAVNIFFPQGSFNFSIYSQKMSGTAFVLQDKTCIGSSRRVKKWVLAAFNLVTLSYECYLKATLGSPSTLSWEKAIIFFHLSIQKSIKRELFSSFISTFRVRVAVRGLIYSFFL